MRVKKIFGSILAGVLIVSGVSMSANAADIAPKNFEHRDRVIELSLERASGSFNMTVPAFSGPVANGALSTGITATTGGASGKGTYTAHGTTWYKGSDGEMKTLELESVDYYMAVRANGGVDLSTEEKQIHTNAAGETYGEALVVKYLNEDVDMISAIGKNGTEGYIKVSDLPQNIPDYVPHDHEIPVYASDGVTVIDSFFISSGYTDTVG